MTFAELDTVTQEKIVDMLNNHIASTASILKEDRCLIPMLMIPDSNQIICLQSSDGSVDVDNLETEGLEPGKILIYRNGSTPPSYLSPDEKIHQILEKEECTLKSQLIGVYHHFLDLYEQTNKKGK